VCGTAHCCSVAECLALAGIGLKTFVEISLFRKSKIFSNRDDKLKICALSQQKPSCHFDEAPFNGNEEKTDRSYLLMIAMSVTRRGCQAGKHLGPAIHPRLARGIAILKIRMRDATLPYSLARRPFCMTN
jgi:hypothetical protein